MAYNPNKIQNVKTRFLKALSEGWSSSVAIAMAGSSQKNFYFYLKHDPEVSAALALRNNKRMTRN